MEDDQPVEETTVVESFSQSPTITTAINSMLQVTHVDANLNQEVFLTTADKARLCLNDALHKMGRRDSWQTPLGILITLGVGFLSTSSFRDFVLPKEAWPALLAFAMILSAGWLIWCLYTRPDSPSVDQVVEELSKGSNIKQRSNR